MHACDCGRQASVVSAASPKVRLGPLRTDKGEPERFLPCPRSWSKMALPRVASLNQGERSMLVKKQLDGFYNELQTPTRVRKGMKSSIPTRDNP